MSANKPEREGERPGTQPPADVVVEETLPLDRSPSGVARTPIDASIADTTGVEASATPTQSYRDQPRCDEAEPPPPELAGYEIIRRVARGGMGEVLEARHLLLNRTGRTVTQLSQFVEPLYNKSNSLQRNSYLARTLYASGTSRSAAGAGGR